MKSPCRILAISLSLAAWFPAAPSGEDGFDWVRRKRQPFPGIDRALALAVDPSGGVLIAGDSGGRGAPTRARAVKLDPAGKEVWSWTGGEGSFSSPDRKSVV